MAVQKDIYIHSVMNESRVAITEDSRLAEYFIEIPDKERLLGSIYFGRVQKIVQGMNAAFVDIGLEQDAFLHFSDVDSSMEDSFDVEEYDDNDTMTDTAAEALRVSTSRKSKKAKPVFQTKRSGDVVINLQPKQNVIVQVVREAYSSKGVRVSTRISLPGRHVVLMPFENVIGVSKKIISYNERRRLRSMAKQVLPPGAGCIIRTAAQNHSDNELSKDWESLLSLWNNIEVKVKQSTRPTLLYKDVSITNSIIRDLLTTDVTSIVVDNTKLYNEIYTYMEDNIPALLSKLKKHAGIVPIFDNYGLHNQIESIYSRRVGLPSGGYIIFDHTEAMLVIDVNTGRATFDSDQETNAFRTNIESAREIARQLRLRDVGGMIVIDFIDMNDEKNRTRLFNDMKLFLSADRAKTVVYPITQLGLIQMTRQRIRQNLSEWVSDECAVCDGSGRVPSKGIITSRIDKWLFNFRKQSREFRLTLVIHPDLATYISEGTFSRITMLMLRYFVKITLLPNTTLAPDEFRFISQRNQRDITKDFIEIQK